MAVAWAVIRIETAICCLAGAKLNCDADDLDYSMLICVAPFYGYGCLGETWMARTYSKVLVVLGRCWRLAFAYTGMDMYPCELYGGDCEGVCSYCCSFVVVVVFVVFCGFLLFCFGLFFFNPAIIQESQCKMS